MKSIVQNLLVLGFILGIGGKGICREEIITVVGEEIVVTAERIKTSLKDSPNTIKVITREDIEASGAKTLVELLKSFTSLSLGQRGGIGKSSSIFIRGADTKHTIVMIDGVKINDPSKPGREANISHVMLDDVERIEIIYGPTGTSYGSDGMGGLLNIITRKKEKMYISIEQGSLETIRGYTQKGGKIRDLGYNAALSYIQTLGISAAKNGKEKDGYNNLLTILFLDYEFNPSFKIETNIRNTKAESEYDRYDYKAKIMVDDLDNIESFKNTIISANILYSPLNWWKNRLMSSSCKTKRKNDEGDMPVETYVGKTKTIDLQSNLQGKNNELAFGGSYEEESCETKDINKKRENKAVYFQSRLRMDILSTIIGARVDNTTFGSYKTYQFGGVLLNEGVTLRANWTAGFKAPSLFQLYAPPNPAWWFLGGNKNLKPEESKSLELGIELEKKIFSFKACHFKNDFKNLIQYYTDPTTWQGTYKNIGSATTEGDEFSISIKPQDNLSILANYTILTKAEDNSTKKRLLLRPKKRWNIHLAYKVSPLLSLYTDIIYCGERFSYGHPLPLPSYTLFNIGTSYTISKNTIFTVKVENLFDEEYEEVYGYGTTGRSFYSGFRFEL
ncbi:TPA: hypothetical protein DCX16_00235 [bacterium]|nr:hypothetical protein [bacterium]